MSTAEAVSVAHAVGLRGWFLRGEPGTAADLVACLAGTAAKDNAGGPRQAAPLPGAAGRRGARATQWQALHDARHLLPG